MWKNRFLFLLLLVTFAGLNAQVEVYIFLREDCIISQHYTVNLKQLHRDYANDSLAFIGVFPNQSSTEMDMIVFKGKYELPFQLVLDHEQVLVKRFGATITPEVVVYDTARQVILYQGRIDDTYYRVGKKRRVTTSCLPEKYKKCQMNISSWRHFLFLEDRKILNTTSLPLK